jgi:PAS domain S-box-containing protein
MMKKPGSKKKNDKKSQEILELRRKLEEAEQALSAIQNGEIDALVVSGENRSEVYTLKSADRPYRTMIEQMNEGAVNLSSEGFILYCNESFARMVNASLEELVTAPIFQYIDVSSQEQFHRLMKYNGQGELRVLTKDKNLIPTYATLNTVQEDGIISHALVLTDLKEHLRTEKVIASERFANILLEQAADAILVCDTSGAIIRASEKAFKLLGGNLVGLPIDRVFDRLFPCQTIVTNSGNSRNPVKFSAIRNGEFLSGIEVSICAEDLSNQYLLLNCGHIIEGNSNLGYSISLTDISERKKAEEKLATVLKQNQSIINNTPAIVYAFDLEERFIMANTALAELFNSTPEKMIGKRRHDFMPEKDADWHEANDRQVLEAGTAMEFDEYSHLKSRYITWLTTKFPLWDAQGRVYAVAGISSDITQRKKAEEDLQRYAKELEAANKELEAFSYSVSHDLRAPLRTLDGFSELVIKDYGDKLDETGKDYLNRVRKASQYMSELIDDMLKLSRITRADMYQDKVNLTEIVQSCLLELKASEPNRQIEFILPLEVLTKGDRQLLSIALRNLLENAWKFTRKCPQAQIEFGISPVNGEKVYYIKDNGIGFNMKYADKLFQPFQRLHSEQEYEGTGIGLAIVQRIIRRHNGKIWAESEKGHGATFFFTLN